ncbi:MAG: MCP four helix bundle domain-containing protein, partial [Nitrospirota bacterium]|nr:MCP four helix bundle domain-containing protein [Nitrospirota bacterium]
MVRPTVLQRFEDLKTQTKLLTAFGVVSVIIVIMSSLGVWTNKRISQQTDAIYVDYTVPLIDFNTMLFNLNKYHETLQDLARAPRATDFKVDVAKIGPYR